VALDVSADRKILYVHVMYMDTPETAREEIKTGFERRVLGILG
jgi:multicomponent Na+:H+ antiporter subunit E